LARKCLMEGMHGTRCSSSTSGATQLCGRYCTRFRCRRPASQPWQRCAMHWPCFQRSGGLVEWVLIRAPGFRRARCWRIWQLHPHTAAKASYGHIEPGVAPRPPFDGVAWHPSQVGQVGLCLQVHGPWKLVNGTAWGAVSIPWHSELLKHPRCGPLGRKQAGVLNCSLEMRPLVADRCVGRIGRGVRPGRCSPASPRGGECGDAAVAPWHPAVFRQEVVAVPPYAVESGPMATLAIVQTRLRCPVRTWRLRRYVRKDHPTACPTCPMTGACC